MKVCDLCHALHSVEEQWYIVPFVSHGEAVAIINHLINATHFYFTDADSSFLITLSLLCQAPLMDHANLSHGPAIVARTASILIRAFSVYHMR